LDLGYNDIVIVIGTWVCLSVYFDVFFLFRIVIKGFSSRLLNS